MPRSGELPKSDLGLMRHLETYAAQFSRELGRPERIRACAWAMYAQLARKAPERYGALGKSERRVIYHFLSRSPWDYRKIMAEIRRQITKRAGVGISALYLHEFQVPRRGPGVVGFDRHVVDVPNLARRYYLPDRPPRSSLGQLADAWSWSDERILQPVTGGLYLSQAWTENARRLNELRVPARSRKSRDRHSTALHLLSEARDGLPPFQVVLLDMRFGSSLELLSKLERRGIPYFARLLPSSGFWPYQPTRFFPIPTRQWPFKRIHRYRHEHARQWRYGLHRPEITQWTPLNWVDENGLTPHLHAEHMEMIPLIKHCRRYCKKRWLVVLRRGTEARREEDWDYLSTLPANTSLHTFSALAQRLEYIQMIFRRWHQQVDTTGFRGRSWEGFHRHMTLTFMALDFFRQFPEHWEIGRRR